MFTIKTQVILASTSETRKKILESYKIYAKYIKHEVDEEKEILKHGKLRGKLARFLARRKVESIQDRYYKNPIIGSDQVILCKDNLINKPSTKEEAIKNLLILQGGCHTLISAICLYTPDGKYKIIEDRAKVVMKKIQKADIISYVENNKSTVYTTSGSYKIEEDKLNCIKKIEGEKETVLGFPVKKFIPFLKKYYT